MDRLDESDAAYFRRRAEAERGAAETAASDRARDIHRELADLYWRCADDLDGGDAAPD